MTSIPDESKVIYRSKNGKNEKDFDALEWLAAMPGCACRTQTGVLNLHSENFKNNNGGCGIVRQNFVDFQSNTQGNQNMLSFVTSPDIFF